MVVLIVAVMFIAIIAISYWRSRKIRQETRDPVPERTPAVTPGVYYHPAHTFAKVMDDNLVKVGMDDFARQAFGQIDAIKLPSVGRILKQGEIAWEAKVGDKKVSQPMPVTGTVVEVNKDAEDSSWIIKVKPLSLRQSLANLISETMAVSWMNAVRARFQDNYSSSLVPVMQDGGELVDGFARHLQNGQWEEFRKEFFNNAG